MANLSALMQQAQAARCLIAAYPGKPVELEDIKIGDSP
jgi:hypothetical protein